MFVEEKKLFINLYILSLTLKVMLEKGRRISFPSLVISLCLIRKEAVYKLIQYPVEINCCICLANVFFINL